MRADPAVRIDGNREAHVLAMTMSVEQRLAIESASQETGQSVEQFVLSSALQAAAHVLADRRSFLLECDAWHTFSAALERPAADITGLSALMRRPTVLDVCAAARRS
jgi:uncharacterized protein (DUF1778 family)